jgi:hypothetical protein
LIDRFFDGSREKLADMFQEIQNELAHDPEVWAEMEKQIGSLTGVGRKDLH